MRATRGGRRVLSADESMPPAAAALDRRGQALLSGQDYDINLTACDVGLGCGVFQSLKLTHLIPARRITTDYLLKLYYGHAFSNAVLFTARGKHPTDPLPNRFKQLLWKVRLRRQPYPRPGVHLGAIDWHPRRTSVLRDEPPLPRLHTSQCFREKYRER